MNSSSPEIHANFPEESVEINPTNPNPNTLCKKENTINERDFAYMHGAINKSNKTNEINCNPSRFNIGVNKQSVGAKDS